MKYSTIHKEGITVTWSMKKHDVGVGRVKNMLKTILELTVHSCLYKELHK